MREYDSYDELIRGRTLRRVFKIILFAIFGWFFWDLTQLEAGEMNGAIIALFIWFLCMYHIIPVYWVSKRTAVILLVMPFILMAAQVSLYLFILPLWPDGGSGFLILDMVFVAVFFLGVLVPLYWAVGGSKVLPDAKVRQWQPPPRTAGKALTVVQVEIVEKYQHIAPKNLDKITRDDALQILELKEPFTQDELKARWREMLKRTHPDTGGSTLLTRLVNAAYEDLK